MQGDYYHCILFDETENYYTSDSGIIQFFSSMLTHNYIYTAILIRCIFSQA